ncbi:hypothetical protein V3C99_013634 [Haemonchus contortus]
MQNYLKLISDGIDPAPDKISGEANRLKAQEPLEDSSEKEKSGAPANRRTQNVPNNRGNPVKNFGRDVVSSTQRSISYTAKETSTKGSVVVSPVTHVVFVKNPPLNPPRGQVIKKMLTVRSMPTPPPTTTTTTTIQTTTVTQPTTSLPESSVQGSDNSAENSDPGSDEVADDTDAEASEEGIEEENTNNEEESHTKEGQTRATPTPRLVLSTSTSPPVSESVTISTDPPVKPSQEPKPEPERGATRKNSVEHINAQQGKDGASWKRVEQRQENRGNKQVQSGSASEDKAGDEKGADVAHGPSIDVQSNYEGFENQEEEKSDQNSEKSIATVSKTKTEATEEQQDEDNNKAENNPEEAASIPGSKRAVVKKEQVDHNVKQEGVDKPVGESEEGALNDASTESYDEEGEGEDYEPDESGQSSERTDPLPNTNTTEEELEQPMDVAELAKLGNSTSAEQEAEEEHEPKGSGTALQETNSVNRTDKNEDEQKKPSARTERKDEKHIWKETVLNSKENKANHAASLSSIRGNTGEWHRKMIRTAEGPKPTAERITDKNKEHGAAGYDRKKSAINAEEDETSGSEEQAFESAEDTDGTQMENTAKADHGSSDKENRIEKMNDHDVPVVEVDSRTKGRDIVIAYNPTYRKGSGVVRAGRTKKPKDVYLPKTKSPSASNHLSKGARYINVPSVEPLPSEFSEQQENLTSSIVAIMPNEPAKEEDPLRLSESASSLSSTKHFKSKVRPSGSETVGMTESPELEPPNTVVPSPTPPNMPSEPIDVVFPTPEELPVTTVLPKSKHLPIKTSPPTFPFPGKLPTKKYSGDFPDSLLGSSKWNLSNIDTADEISNNDSTATFPRPKKLPQKIHPLEFPRPRNIKKNKAKKGFPRPKHLPRKNNLPAFPKPKKTSAEKMPSEFPRPKKLPVRKISDFPRPDNNEEDLTTVSTELPTETIPAPSDFPDFRDGPVIEPSIDLIRSSSIPQKKAEPSGSDASENDPDVTEKDPDVAEKELEELSLSELPKPDHPSLKPSVFKGPGSSKIVAHPDFVHSILSAGGGGVAILLPSNSSSSENDTPSQIRPIVINVPNPQQTPLNVTITRRTVHRYKKTHRKNAKPDELGSEATPFNKKQAKSAWKVRMIPKSSLKSTADSLPDPLPVDQPPLETSTEQSSIEPVLEPVASESINEPLVEIPQPTDEIAVPTTAWEYVTAPGEPTASPELLKAYAALDSLLITKDRLSSDDGIKTLDKERSSQGEVSLENGLGEKGTEIAPNPASEVVEPQLDFVEPSSAESARNGATPDRTVAKEIMERIVRPKTSTIILKEPRRPFKLDCTTEEDQKGALCEIWAQSGLCQAHRPTMFLFCRKTCLCGGDPALD